MATGPYLSIINLNVNGLNVPTKRQRLAEWIQKQNPYICFGHLMRSIDLLGKDPDAGKDWGQEDKGMTEDEMAGWHNQLNGQGFE